jgi:methylglyoxal synthase
MEKAKRIALVAHDNMKHDLAEWVRYNWKTLLGHSLVCTGTTGKMVEETIVSESGEDLPKDLEIRLLKSGPLGGDQQLGALIAEGGIDIVIFFWDPMSPQPHDVDVKALLRIAVLYNIPMACNRSSADFLISSPLLAREYHQQLRDYSGYLARAIP